MTVTTNKRPGVADIIMLLHPTEQSPWKADTPHGVTKNSYATRQELVRVLDFIYGVDGWREVDTRLAD